MTDKSEAKVEVLTAEVRVVQVGRRQVTLSVVRQLDWANPADVEPFGRVRTGDTPPGRLTIFSGYGSSLVKSATPVEIIGAAAGALVRSVSWHNVLMCAHGEQTACPELRAVSAELDRYRDQGQPLLRQTPEWKRVSDKYAAHHGHDWAHYDPDRQTYDMWRALPLIVLAGLR